MSAIRFVLDRSDPAVRRFADLLSRGIESSEGMPVVYSSAEDGEGARLCAVKRADAPDRFNEPLGEEGYRIQPEGSCIWIIGEDTPGLCYGMDELTRTLKDGRSLDMVKPAVGKPHFAFRAIKFNLPWSCYRSNQSVLLHMDTVRDLRFWDAFLDMMAEHRFNVLTLWNVHPFPYMTRSASFPLACPFDDNELARWREFYTGLFARCRERCVRPFVLSMNTFVSKAFVEHYDSKANDDGIHWGMAYSTPETEAYIRESVEQIINEYPDLAGVGTSLGEHMDGWTPQEREAYCDRVYHEAVRRAKRPVELIRRAPFSANTSASVTRDSVERNAFPMMEHPVWMEIKYNFSHGYSSPKLLAAHGVTRQSAGGADKARSLLSGYWDPEPSNYKMALMVRNEDFFILRWAQPDFVRAHIAENDRSYVGGYFIGSEGFIPAAEYAHRPGSTHQIWRYAFEKNRLYYMIWGRLLFDPSSPDEAFERDIDERYGAGVGKPLLDAYRFACRMPMALATFHASTWDFSLYSEGFISTRFPARMFTDWSFNGYARDRSFITLEALMNCSTLDPDWMSVKQYAEYISEGRSTQGKTTPIDAADQLDADAESAERALESVRGSDPALECEVWDVRAWIALSRYFADKLRAAAAMGVYLMTHDPKEREEAVRRLDAPNAKAHWQELVDITQKHYHETPLVSLGTQPFSWRLMLDDVEADIEYAKGRHVAPRKVNLRYEDNGD
jgi:hypothetical protein